MHILFLTPQLPFPPRQGTSIRNYNLIARMAKRHTVDLLSFLAPGDTLDSNSPLHQHCRRIATVDQPIRTLSARLKSTLMSNTPDMALRLEASAMHHLVQDWTESTHYDILQIEGIELAQYSQDIADKTTAVVFDNHNCEYLLQQRNAMNDLRQPRRWHAAAYSLVQWQKLRRYEATVCNRATATLAVSAPDQHALQRIAPLASIHVAPNGIDLSDYAVPTPSDIMTRPERFTLLFTGKMDYRPNIDAVLWFAQEVLPALVASAPQVHFQIVGMNPHPRLDSLRGNPHIEITGAVPDPRPYLHAADLVVMPLRVGGGTRFKALEAMAAGKAIVSTSLGVEGIGITNQREMLLADDPDEFALAILRVLSDSHAGGELVQRLGQRARDFVAKHYAWDTIIPLIDQIYSRVQPQAASTSARQLAPETN